MNGTYACHVLGIDPTKYTKQLLKKQYYLKALEYHPDKCKHKDAVDRFHEIKDAYDYLSKWGVSVKTIWDSDSDSEEGEDEDVKNGATREHLSSYQSLLRYFTGTLDETLKEEYTNIFLDKLLSICEKQAIEIMKKAEDRKFNTIYKILTKYKNLFHLSADFYEEMEKNKIYRFVQGELKKKRVHELVHPEKEAYDTKVPYEIPTQTSFPSVNPDVPNPPPPASPKKTRKVIDSEWDLEIEMEVPTIDIVENNTRITETMILKPSLDDLWENNLYRYKQEKTFLIPLWHHEMVYEKNEYTDFVVKLQPKMPTNNMWIDEHNNLHQKQEYRLHELWGFATKEQGMFVYYGKKKFMFYPHEISMAKYQKITWSEQGVSTINEDSPYDVSKKGDVILHVYVV